MKSFLKKAGVVLSILACLLAVFLPQALAAGTADIDTSNVQSIVSGNLAIDTVLNDKEPKEGLFGLNVYSGTATFKSVVNFNDKYTYNGTGSLTVLGDARQTVTALYNKTLSNTKVDRAFYSSNGRKLIIDASYFELLPVGTYTFKAMGGSSAYEFTVNVTAVTQTTLKDLFIQKGCNAVIYLGNIEVSSVSVNGKQLAENEYKVKNLMLTVYAELLTKSENTIVINGDKTVIVTIE